MYYSHKPYIPIYLRSSQPIESEIQIQIKLKIDRYPPKKWNIGDWNYGTPPKKITDE